MVYQPGEIRVVAYDADGKVAGEKTLRTAGKPSTITLAPDRRVISADGVDLSFVTVSMTDNNGVLVPDADNQMEFEITGAGHFKAACNGDAISLEPFTKPTMRLFHGQLVVVVESSKDAGEILIKVRDSKNKKLVAETIIRSE